MIGSIIAAVLSNVTVLYLLYSSYMDLKERMIYSTPANILSGLWIILACYMKALEIKQLFIYLLIQAGIYLLIKFMSIWGDGDNDVLLLLAALLPVVMRCTNLSNLLFMEALLTSASVFLAILISIPEYRIKSKSWSIKADAAVVPGFAAVIIMVFIYRFVRGIVR